MLSESKITSAFDMLKERKVDHFKTVEELAFVKRELESKKLIGLADGTIDGKNAELREASAREKLADLFASVEKAERFEREARLYFDLAQVEVDYLKTILRLAELHQKL